jgi:hypothetical protein
MNDPVGWKCYGKQKLEEELLFPEEEQFFFQTVGRQFLEGLPTILRMFEYPLG